MIDFPFCVSISFSFIFFFHFCLFPVRECNKGMYGPIKQLDKKILEFEQFCTVHKEIKKINQQRLSSKHLILKVQILMVDLLIFFKYHGAIFAKVILTFVFLVFFEDEKMLTLSSDKSHSEKHFFELSSFLRMG